MRSSPQLNGSHLYGKRWHTVMSRYSYKIRHSLITRLIVLDRQSFWSHRVQSSVYQQFQANPPDLVIASLPPVSILRAASRISKVTGARLALDFRDLWKPSVMNRGTLDRAWLSVAEGLLKKWAELSEFTTGVSGEIVSALESRLAISATLVANGVEPHEWKNVSPMEFGTGTHVVYTGKFYPEYSSRLRQFATAFSLMATQYNLWFHYFGPDSHIFREAFQREGIETRIKCYGEVERPLTHQAQRAANVLLLLAGGSGYQVNTKVYDYLAAGRPILTVGPPNGELAELVQYFGEGQPVETGVEIRGRLAALVEQKRELDPVEIRSRIREMSREKASKCWVNNLLASTVSQESSVAVRAEHSSRE